ncbi:NADH dehydrogenase subunit J, partial [Prunus dulcis]
MSFDVLGVSVFIEALIFVLILISSNNKKKITKIETVMNSIIEFPLLDRTTQNSVISTTSSDLSNWSRLSSLWPLLYGTSCCFIEFASLIGSRFDFDRYGLVPRSSPRQADLILTAGTVTMKMAPSLVRLYEQMPEPKYVIAMGACTITGGMFSTDSYSTVRGVDKLIPVDVYLPGCPPKPEAVIDAITKLRKKISREIYEDRIRSQQENRSFPRISELGRILLYRITNVQNNKAKGESIFINFIIFGFRLPRNRNFTNKTEDWHSIAVILYVYGYNYLRSQCAYDVAPGGLLASVYHLTRIEYGIDQPEEVCIKVFAPRRNPRIPSIFWVWKSADFQERESYLHRTSNLPRSRILEILPYNYQYAYCDSQYKSQNRNKHPYNSIKLF